MSERARCLDGEQSLIFRTGQEWKRKGKWVGCRMVETSDPRQVFRRPEEYTLVDEKASKES